MRNGVRTAVGALALLVACLQLGPALAQGKPSEMKIAIVQFLSGAAAPHDASAVNTAKLLTEQFNAAGGIEGVRLNTLYVDEAGSSADKVAEYRRLVQDEKITIAIGYTSSANCLAVAPLADELKTERAQAAVDLRRTTAALAESVAGGSFDEEKARTAANDRMNSAERTQIAVTAVSDATTGSTL